MGPDYRFANAPSHRRHQKSARRFVAAMNPLRVLFPKARRSVTFVALLPLFVFLAVFAAGCVYVEWRVLMRFSYRPAFALAAVLPWVWWLHHAGGAGLSRGRALVALFTRFIMIAALILL